MEKFVFTVDESDSGMRLDTWLTARMPDKSRSAIQRLVRQGKVSVNGRLVKPNRAIRTDDEIVVLVPDPIPTELVPEDIPLDIVFEDNDIIVLNKPEGLVVHPACGHPTGTLVNALLYHCPDLQGIGGTIRPGIVHRLDKGTSGLLVVAKNEQAMNNLSQQFKARTVKKTYLALVHGIPDPRDGRIETLIGRHSYKRTHMSVRDYTGRNAVTVYAVEQELGDFALVRVRIETGRTHQIRVHMAHIGHPVVADPYYGKRKEMLPFPAERQLLHAWKLCFMHPGTEKGMTFKAPLPPDMTEAIRALKGC